MAIVDANGTVVASYEYDPYGNILSDEDAPTNSIAAINPMRYRGYYYDTETGFYYLQSRYYDPAIGRFINADSYSSTGQGILGNNMYAYCLNNPIANTDVSGNMCSASFSFWKSCADVSGETTPASVDSTELEISNNTIADALKANRFSIYRGCL